MTTNVEKRFWGAVADKTASTVLMEAEMPLKVEMNSLESIKAGYRNQIMSVVDGADPAVVTLKKIERLLQARDAAIASIEKTTPKPAEEPQLKKVVDEKPGMGNHGDAGGALSESRNFANALRGGPTGKSAKQFSRGIKYGITEQL